MGNAVATVVFLQGQAWAKAADGSLRPLSVGSLLDADEVLVTARGAHVQLDFGNGEPVPINGGLQVAMSRDFSAGTATSPDEAALDDASIQEALTVLEQGGDLLDVLEETAAGDTGGSGSDGNNSFVQLTRILETIDSQSFNYPSTAFSREVPLIETDGAYSNRAPSVTNQALSGNEDEVISGRIIASDVEGDPITYAVVTMPVNGVVRVDAITGHFTFTPNANYSGGDSFVVTVTDSQGNVSIATVSLDIIAVNDAPEAANVDFRTNEDTPISGQVVAKDIEDDVLAYTISSPPANGTVTINSTTGDFTYTPNPNFNGPDSFVVTIADGKGGTTTSRVTIGVTPVNDLPTSVDLSFTTHEDVAVAGKIVASDVDGDRLQYSITATATNGIVTINPMTGDFTYTPNANFNGSDSFVVTIADGKGGTTTSRVTIGVTPVNDLPISADLSFTTHEEVAVAGKIVASDLDGDRLQYSITTTATNGTVTINSTTGDFTYTPNANFNGSDAFVVTIADGKGGTTTSRVTVGVTPVNDLPTSADLSFTTHEDVAVAGKIVASDLDGDHLQYSITTTATNGTVTINPMTGDFTYTPNANFNGADSFLVTIADGKGGTATSRVTVGVTPVNDLPTSADLSFTTHEDVAIAGKILASDVDGDHLQYSITTTATNGTVTINPMTGDFTYTPNPDFNGSDAFVVTIADGKGGTTTSRVTVGVMPVNDLPVAGIDNAITNENTAVIIAVRANDSDPDGHNLTVIGVTQGAHGSVVIDPVTGNPLYTPNSGFAGNDSFTYTISDGAGGAAMASVHVTVNPVNQAPVAVAESITVAEGGVATTLNGGAASVLANDSDADGDPLTAVLVSGPAYGSLILDPNGTFRYVHNGGETGSDKFSYRVNDGTVDGNLVEVIVNITPVNDAPVGVADRIDVNEGGTAAVLASGATSVLANDLDAEGNPLTAVLVSGPANGALTLNADGTFSYVHNGSETRVDQFTYRVNDGSANSNIVTVDIVVTPVNDLPASDDVGVSGNEDTPIVVNLSGSDADGSVAGYVIKSLPANGVLYSDVLMANAIVIGTLVSGPIYFMPDADWNGRTGFTYVARDNESGDDLTPARVTIDVIPVPDAALVGVGSGNVKEDTPAQTSVAGILAITDGDAGEALFNARADSPGTYGSFSIDASGNWTYVLDNSKPDVQALKEGETREDTFSVTSLDGASTWVTIRVSGTNDGPVATADTATVKQNTVLILTPAQLLGNDFDADSDSLAIESVQGAANGTVSLSGDNVVFTPTPGYHGPASFTYTLGDGKGGSSTASVSIIVIPNNAPDAGADTAGAVPYSVALGDASPTDSWTNLDSKGKGVYITAYKTSGEATLLYTGSVDGNNNVLGVAGTPRARSDVPNQIEYDVATGKSESILLTLHGNLNQASVGVSRLYPGESGGEVGMWEAYYNGVLVASRTFRLSGTAEYGTFTIDTGNLPFNSIRFSALHTNNNTGDGGDYFLTSFAGSGPASINSNLSVVADTPNTLNAGMLLANDTDPDGDSLVIASVQDGINGNVSLVGGNVVFTPASGYTGPASFTYTLADGRGGTDTATVHLMVERINHAPAPAADTQATDIGTALSIPASRLLANDTDADGDSFMLVSVQDAVNGSVTLSGSNVIFTPIANYEGPASFTYTVRDALGATSTAVVNVGVGAASAPSLVVSKSLVAIAHGSGGTSVKFPIITQLVDADGSESLSIKVSGVPTSLGFNAGTDLGGGIWQFTEADLPNLTLNLPGNYSTATNGTNLTVQVISTEANGGFTASVQSGVTLKAAFTTTDITTTDAGNYSGNSANEYIRGGTGNNTIHGGNGNNIIDGGAGNDSLSAGSGSDVIYGGSGDDVINTGSGTDRIYGGSGNDTLKAGNAGENSVDVFVWTLNDQGTAGAPAVDTLQNFSTSAAGINANGGDVLDLRDLLQGEALGPNNSAGNLADYLHFEIAGGSTLIHISHTGGFTADSHAVGGGYTNAAETQQIILEGVNLQTIYAGASSDQQIITQLLNSNKLITD